MFAVKEGGQVALSIRVRLLAMLQNHRCPQDFDWPIGDPVVCRLLCRPVR